ncbi:MAG TPA: ABC transporter permease subunit, partial [Tepidisphaeraceae bacterium]
MLGIPTYLWRLLPANPILLRVVSIAGKRKRDLVTRCVYLGLLLGVVALSLANAGTGASTSLNDLTTSSEAIFYRMSFLQLFLVALLAPIFTAGAITQEKDSQTYDILLSTPLSNAQIVLGSLCSRLFFIIALLVSGIPVFSINKIFGGVAISAIVVSFSIAAATACVTGALATAIATFKVGTRRTIFSFYMLVVVYLVGIYLLAQLDVFKPLLINPAGGPGELSTTTWFTGIHPFLALQTLFHGYRPPDVTLLPPDLRRWPLEWYFSRPATFFPTLMMLLSVVLVLPSIMLLRRMAQSTSSIRGSLLKLIPIKAVHAARKSRTVWNNPIAWREARTKASAARASFLRYGFILLGLGGAVAILFLYVSEVKQPTNYIQAGSFDRANGTLHILGENQTYSIDSYAARITLDGQQVASNMLMGRYEVVTRNLSTFRGTKTITDITLRSVSGRITRQQANQFLLGGIIVEIAVILLIV